MKPLASLSFSADAYDSREPADFGPDAHFRPGDKLKWTYSFDYDILIKVNFSNKDFNILRDELYKVTCEWLAAINERETNLKTERTEREERLRDLLAGKGW